MKQISILGCGWLGLPLAKRFIEKGIVIKGSTTSEEKLEMLSENKIVPFLLKLQEEKVIGDVGTFLKDSQVLIVDVPPKLRGENKENFVAKIQRLIPFIESSTVEKVLFVSSTSVYNDCNVTVTETTVPQPDSEGGKQLLVVEALLQGNLSFKTTILRFGGLIGPDRNPARFLAGKKNLEHSKAPVNLIHQEDCIGIIENILANQSWGEVYNAVHPDHPTREGYYIPKAIEAGLEPPSFDPNSELKFKIVSSDKILNQLNYIFVKPL
jgi:nucleoside-diphosphate-sugar epimerase